jgi:hypothetical protein
MWPMDNEEADIALQFEGVDLRADEGAGRYVKHETVEVQFARAPGALASREGANHYDVGDALITGSGGDRWSVTRARFDARYEPVPPLRAGHDGAYRNLAQPVLARQIRAPFSVRRCEGGDLLRGRSGDWLLQYAPGDWGIVDAAKFRRVYRALD